MERAQPLADPRIGVGREPVRELHQVAVGVVVGAALGVRHGVLLLRAPYFELTEASIRIWAMGSERKRTRLPAADRREQLLDAAAAILLDAGFGALTMERLAERAGVS
ncbi:MAG TPA: TetR family transcriptional regulator, partial [Myxococcota bacterium]|nr:TetR family transcriptional regulator [Myxococcota bacterium]